MKTWRCLFCGLDWESEARPEGWDSILVSTRSSDDTERIAIITSCDNRRCRGGIVRLAAALGAIMVEP